MKLFDLLKRTVKGFGKSSGKQESFGEVAEDPIVDAAESENHEIPRIEELCNPNSHVPNPNHDPYLDAWNNRKQPEIIELEMPELTFETRFDLSKVRGFDFGMENNQISIFLDGKNRIIAKEDIESLNPLLEQAHKEDPSIPLLHINPDDVRFEPSKIPLDDYTRICILPLTKTGKIPKFTIKMTFHLLSQDQHWEVMEKGGKEVFGRIWYLKTGEIGKAEVIGWDYNKDTWTCNKIPIRREKDGSYSV